MNHHLSDLPRLNDLSALLQPKPISLILLIDDDIVTRTQIRRFLERERYQVVEAGNGKEGLDAYKRLQPTVVLVDGRMPVMDGFECCAQIQTLPNAEHTPVLMITGLDDQTSVDRAFEAGATDFVTKPLHWAVLRQRVRRLIQQSQMLQQLEAANRMFQQLASTDALTELVNRRQFDSHLDQEWRRSAREQTPLSVILCDVDFFKRYNDADGYGHQKGDECLRQVARALRAAARRPGDVVARYGGEEFAVLLPNTPLEGATRVAEAIRASVRALQLRHPNSPVSEWVTLSLGIASVLPHQTFQFLPEALITAADKALYEAKAANRDRYCVHLLS